MTTPKGYEQKFLVRRENFIFDNHLATTRFLNELGRVTVGYFRGEGGFEKVVDGMFALDPEANITLLDHRTIINANSISHSEAGHRELVISS